MNIPQEEQEMGRDSVTSISSSALSEESGGRKPQKGRHQKKPAGGGGYCRNLAALALATECRLTNVSQ